MPPANGRWDKAHRRVLFIDGGDVVMVDALPEPAARSPGPPAARASPRWAQQRHARHLRPRRQPVHRAGRQSGEPSLVTQLTDVGPKQTEPRLTDSQKFIRDEEEKLIDYVREAEGGEEEGARRRQKKDKLPAFELQDRQIGADLMLSPDDTHVFILVAGAPDRREEHDRAELRDRDRLHRGHSRPHERRRHAGSPAARDAQPEDRQDRVGRRQLRAAGRRGRERRLPPTATTPAKAAPGRQGRTRDPLGDAGGFRRRQAGRGGARSADNKDRWLVTLDPETGQDESHRRCCTTTPGCGKAAAGSAASSVEFLPDNQRIWFLSERDGWMHLYTLDVSRRARQAEAADIGQVGGRRAAELSRDGKKFYITTTEVHPGERQVYTCPGRRRRAHARSRR